MGAPRVHSPFWTTPPDDRRRSTLDVSVDVWLRAAHKTDEELWEQMQRNRTPVSATPSAPLAPSSHPDGAAAVERPPRAARLALAPPVDGGSDRVTLRPGGPRAAPAGAATPQVLRSRRRFITCTNCGETFTPPKAKRKATRYLPPEPRFVSWIEARG